MYYNQESSLMSLSTNTRDPLEKRIEYCCAEQQNIYSNIIYSNILLYKWKPHQPHSLYLLISQTWIHPVRLCPNMDVQNFKITCTSLRNAWLPFFLKPAFFTVPKTRTIWLLSFLKHFFGKQKNDLDNLAC